MELLMDFASSLGYGCAGQPPVAIQGGKGHQQHLLIAIHIEFSVAGAVPLAKHGHGKGQPPNFKNKPHSLSWAWQVLL
jgi:hypothetical protein